MAPAAAPADTARMTSTAPASPAPAPPEHRSRLAPPPDVAPEFIYSPDDPAYGPPGPDWYQKKREEQQEPAEYADAADPYVARGPFEAHHSGDHEAVPFPADDPPDTPVEDAASLNQPEIPAAPEISSYEPPASVLPELDFGEPSDPEAGSLGQVKDMYETAESIGPDGLILHFDQLLERQRELISDYFSEAGSFIPVTLSPIDLSPLGLALPAEPPDPAEPDPPPPSALPLGFDGPETLAGLRGELRGAP
jgi:hypothetical protein